MDKKDKYLIIAAIIFCICLAVLSPLIASGDPDGLEKSAEDASVSEEVEKAYLSVPFPDYTFEPMSTIGEILVLFVGGVISLVVAIGIAQVVKKRS